jgi:hypothetical protein
MDILSNALKGGKNKKAVTFNFSEVSKMYETLLREAEKDVLKLFICHFVEG